MSLGTEREREHIWTQRGKGNGLRWLMLRDLIAGLALQSMITTEAEDYMTLLRGISWGKTRVFLTELERMKAIEQIQENGTWRWRATNRGVLIFCGGSRKAIPARIARAAWTTVNVHVSAIGSKTPDSEEASNLE